MENELAKTRDEMEKEIERRLRTRQLQDSLTAQQQKFDDVTRRLEEEDKKRRSELGREAETEKISNMVGEFRRENEGLKIKVIALEENNRLLKQMKDESQNEIDRLRRAVEDLRVSVLEATKREPIQIPQAQQPPPPPQPQPRPEYPIIMPITMPEPKREPSPAPPPQPVPTPQPPVTVHIQQPPQPEAKVETAPVRDYGFEEEKRKLEELRKGLEKQERVRQNLN